MNEYLIVYNGSETPPTTYLTKNPTDELVNTLHPRIDANELCSQPWHEYYHLSSAYQIETSMTWHSKNKRFNPEFCTREGGVQDYVRVDQLRNLISGDEGYSRCLPIYNEVKN